MAAPEFHAGDTLPLLTGRCLTGPASALLAVDGTGSAAVAHVLRADQSVITRPVDVAVDGTWQLRWQAGDLNGPGLYEVEVQVTFPAGSVQTFGPQPFTVSPQIA